MGLYSYNAQRTSKGGKNISHAIRLWVVAFSLFSPRFNVIFALSEYRRAAKLNLFVKKKIMLDEEARNLMGSDVPIYVHSLTVAL